MSIEISNAVWRSSKSTGRARLVMLAIADHQGEIGAWPSIQTIAKMVNASERSVQRDIQELVALGELIVEYRQAPSRGQYKANLYWVNLPEVTDLIPEVTDSTSEVTESASEVTAGGVLTITRTIKEPLKTYGDLDLLFDEFWDVYPRKTNKQAAHKAFRSALGRVDAETIVAGAVKLANDPNLPELQFVPHGATWLNGSRWDDPPYPVRKRSVQEQADFVSKQRQERREREIIASRQFLAEQEQKAAEASPPPVCEHGKNLVRCRACLEKIKPLD